jgi:prepilin-type N-terminal cleavage/methylation domain-containing protein
MMLPLIFEKKILSQQAGFTLIEVMVAFAIFVLGIVGCYTLQVNSSLSSSKSNTVGSASTWAQYMAEDLLSRQYADDNSTRTDALLKNIHTSAGGSADGLTDVNATVAGTSDGVRYVHINGSIDTVAAGALYSIFWNIVDSRPMPNIKQIRIIVVKNAGINAMNLYTQDYFKLGPI